ncbi:MAG TPA: PLP-dependent transferase, partial [Casimicrobiaceae bacterium]|nr:PLP-dependent transferase [Casimicrobiaceae bacterium]
MTDAKSSRGLQTRIVRAEDDLTPGFESFAVPVTRASTVVFPDLATMRALDWRNDAQWRYGLHATPTSLVLAQRLAALEGGNHALLQPSGLSSISNVYFGLVKTGDDVLIPDNVYSPNRDHGDWLARDFGITTRFYDPMIGAGIADLIQPNTRLIWLEAPGSVTMEVPDVRAITTVARARNVVTAIDNTWSAGLAFRPFEQGVDISVQALTKYQSG